MDASVPIAAAADPIPQPLPFFEAVSAGFPSPAGDYLEESLDLNQFMVARPAATYFLRVRGDSMRDASIVDGDVVVVDRSVNAVNGKIVVAVIDGEFVVKRFRSRGDRVWLQPENPAFDVIELREGCEIWGVVVGVIRKT